MEIDGVKSEAVPLDAGVGQGSALSPLLFILTVSPFAEFLGVELACMGVYIFVFADDISLLMWADTWVKLGKNMCIAYTKSYSWCGSTGGILNEGKTDILPLLTARDVISTTTEIYTLKEDIPKALTIFRVKDIPKVWCPGKSIKLMGLKLGALLDGRHMIKGRLQAANIKLHSMTKFMHHNCTIQYLPAAVTFSHTPQLCVTIENQTVTTQVTYCT